MIEVDLFFLSSLTSISLHFQVCTGRVTQTPLKTRSQVFEADSQKILWHVQWTRMGTINLLPGHLINWINVANQFPFFFFLPVDFGCVYYFRRKYVIRESCSSAEILCCRILSNYWRHWTGTDEKRVCTSVTVSRSSRYPTVSAKQPQLPIQPYKPTIRSRSQ